MGGMPMGGMPMGGMPMGMGEALAAGEGGKEDAGRHRKIASREIPHTEDVTGRVDTNRLAVASAATRDKNEKSDEAESPRSTRLNPSFAA